MQFSKNPLTFEQQYLELLNHLILVGDPKEDRTGTGTLSVFGIMLEANLKRDGFPLLTTKKVHFKSIAHELLWFLKGTSSADYLRENNVKIWEEWTLEDGTLGRVYGCQWRDWRVPFTYSDSSCDNYYENKHHKGNVDQITQVIDSIKNNPNSRRHLVSAWNPAEIEEMALPPCHYAFQFYCQNDSDRTLDLMFQMRSADTFLGLPFNIASYALLLKIVCYLTGRTPGVVKVCIGDCHLYQNHILAARTQLSRKIISDSPPKLKIVKSPNQFSIPQTIDEFTFDNFELQYYSCPAIKAPISI